MKIVDRYLIGQLLKPMAACTVIFTILVFVGHFFDKMSVFNNFHAHVADVALYLILGLPYWLNVIFPVVTLLALMFSLGPLQQNGEITALRGAGISSLRLYAPFLAMGVLISLISLFGGMTYFPILSSKANVIYRQRIKQERVYSTLKDHIVAAGRDHQSFTIGTLDVGNNQVKDVVIDRFDEKSRLVGTLSAREGDYRDGRWVFYDGKQIVYTPQQAGTFQEVNFTSVTVLMNEKPEDFMYEDRRPDDMSHREIRSRIRHLNDFGMPSFKEQVALHLQFALPFANVVVILLGIPFALSRRKGNVQSIAYAFGTTFLYWGTVSVFQSLGEQGRLPGWVSAWAANFIFGTLAVWLLRQTKKV